MERHNEIEKRLTSGRSWVKIGLVISAPFEYEYEYEYEYDLGALRSAITSAAKRVRLSGGRAMMAARC